MATASRAQGLHGPLRLAMRITGWYFAAAVLSTYRECLQSLNRP